MTESILDDTKSQLNIPTDSTAFDLDIITSINTAFMILNQLGLGPSVPFSINDNTAQWSNFMLDINKYNGVKTYIFMKVRLVMDPPNTAHLLSALKEQITELEYRLRELYEYNNQPIQEVLP